MRVPISTSEDLKTALSGLDLKLDIENIQSSVNRVPSDMIDIIGLEVYNEIMDHMQGNTPEPELPEPTDENPEPEAIDEDVVAEAYEDLLILCRRAFAPLAVYKHFIWLQVRVSNYGVTTYKSSDETTAYRYQTDEAKENLLDSWADYISQMIDLMNSKPLIFTTWAKSDQCAAQAESLFNGFRDFCKVVNIRPADAAFFYRVVDMLNDITNDEIKAIDTVASLKEKPALLRKAQKMVAYRALSLAAVQFDVSALPAPVRRTMLNEMNGKNTEEFNHVKTRLAGFYKTEAESWLQKILTDIEAERVSDSTATDKTITTSPYTETDKVIGIC